MNHAFPGGASSPAPRPPSGTDPAITTGAVTPTTAPPTLYDLTRHWNGPISSWDLTEGRTKVAELRDIDEPLARRIALLLTIARGTSDAALREIERRANGVAAVAEIARGRG